MHTAHHNISHILCSIALAVESKKRSGLLPQKAPFMVAEKHKLSFSFLYSAADLKWAQKAQCLAVTTYTWGRVAVPSSIML